jgi:SsrA-binding protein
MTKQKRQNTKLILNRRAKFDYELSDSLVVGIELTGGEVRSLRTGHGYLRGAYVTVKDGQLWLTNATISGTNGVTITEGEQTRARRLLAKRREIDRLIASKQQGKTIIPLEINTQGRFIKLRIAVGKGKRQYDKRQLLKQKDQEKNIRQKFMSIN